ncbi:MAG: LarC family nickel insertion protein [Alphaproteobacteria bacterium]
MHIHIDPIGGIAGDMFLAAVLDAWPERFDGLDAAVRAAGLPREMSLRVVPHVDHGLSGTRFVVEYNEGGDAYPAGAYRDITARLRAADLAPDVRERSLAIFALLAEAEAQVHDVPIEEVRFHELAGWDSIADVVGAAYLIDQLAADSWSVAPLPLGRGRVTTAHGPLPVPAPAAARLLEGFSFIDDGIEGERVTPTGAAILRHLNVTHAAPDEPLRLERSGFGLGVRKLAGLSNALRLLAFESEAARLRDGEQVGVISFEVDDQTPEELAAGLDALRVRDGVLDVLQIPAFGKKGRMMMSVQVLCRPEQLGRVVEACFTETTTIGLRWRRTMRTSLPRRSVPGGEAGEVSVKVVERPGGRRTAKADIDPLRSEAGGGAALRRRRQQVEIEALEEREGD